MRRHTLAVTSLLATSLAIPFTRPASAQSDSSSLTGAVTDASGAFLPNAKVTIRNQATRLESTLTTNADGNFNLPNVAPGDYQVRVESNGFQSVTLNNVHVDASIGKRVDVSLKVGDAGTSVTVEASSNTVQTESAVLGQLVTQEQVKSIQLNGRNPELLAQMEPGVIRTQPMTQLVYGLDNSTQIGGARSESTLITLDGAPMVRTRAEGTSVGAADVDSTSQVQVLTSAYPAEYGRSDGGQIRIVPKSGTSSFHGAAFEFLRNNFFNANTWQRKLPSNPLIIQQHPSAFRYNQFGWNLNGPLYIPNHFNKSKEHLFFLFGQEWTDYTYADIVYNKVPTALMHQGNFSELLQPNILYGCASATNCSNNQIYHPYVQGSGVTPVPYANNIITDPLSPNGIALINAFPLPNANAATYNWVDSAANINTQRKDTLVVDYVPADAHRIRLTILNYTFHETSPHNGNFNKLPQKWSRPNQVAVLHYSWAINSKTVNEAIASGASDHVTIGVDTSSGLYNRTMYGINYPYLFPASQKDLPNKYPTISMPNLTLLDGTPYPSKSGGVVLTFADNLTRVWGNHTVKVGASAEYAGENNKDQITVSNTPGSTNNQNGRFNFSDARVGGATTGIGMANSALGLFDTYGEIGQRSYTLYRAWAYDAFAQDSWRVNPNLVLEFGVHYSFYNPYYAKWGNQSVFSQKDYSAANAPTVNRTTGIVTGTEAQLYDGVVIPGSGFPSSANGHLNPAILADGYAFAFRGYSNQYSPTIKTDFQPRAGFTYQVNSGMVIRGGGGRYVQRLGITDNVFTGGNAPFQPSAAVSLGSVDNPGGNGAANNYPQLYSSQAYNYPSPNAYNWNLTIDQELKSLGVLTLSYGGRRGVHLEELLNINQLQPGTVFLPANKGVNTDALRQYQGYNAINQATNAGGSIYNSLQANLRRRLTKGLLFGVAYTWSKGLDFGSSNGTKLPNTYNQSLMWGRSDYDRRHVFLANLVYNIDQFDHANHWVTREAFGRWQFSGTFQAQTGAGLGVTTSTDYAGVGSGSGSQYVWMLHPTSTSKSFAGQGSTKTWFDTSAYVTSSSVLTTTYAGQFFPRGARNVISGPGFHTVSAALNKSWTLVPGHESTALTFRAESFNLMNSPSPDNPDTGYTSGTFGQSKTKGGTYDLSRNFQFSLRLSF